MGTHSSIAQTTSKPGIFNPDLRDWKMVGEGENYFIWRHSHTQEELEEYTFTATDSQELDQMRRVFEFRHEKDYIVATRYCKE